MFQRRIPDWLRHAPTPGIKGFAILAAVESTARGILTSVFPIVMYRTFGDAETVSEVYFLIGIFSFAASLFTPWVSRFIPRRKLFTLGALGMIGGSICAAIGGGLLVPLGLTAMTTSTVVITICLNAYVMDYVTRSSLGECETLRLFYSGAAWALGPFLGIWLLEQWPPAPFIISAVASLILLITFWVLRLGDGKIITKSKTQPPNPLAFLPRFFEQPRLIGGWLFAVVRSSGWWVYVVYLPIYAVENGFSEQVGGITLSITNSLLFLVPLMLRWMCGRIRLAVRVGFVFSGLGFLAAALISDYAGPTIVLLMAASFFLILLDMCAGLPFLMAVRPSERTEMSAVYSTYRDVSGVISPGVARVVLMFAPLPGVFAVTAIALVSTALLAKNLHPRLGAKRQILAS